MSSLPWNSFLSCHKAAVKCPSYLFSGLSHVIHVYIKMSGAMVMTIRTQFLASVSPMCLKILSGFL